ncbi:MAG: hypothetical protein M1820_000865 [Bogoriella megaspora]|nr:MAG: hypothetical protein M1820_000865 [Bogoriella megaspora]
MSWDFRGAYQRLRGTDEDLEKPGAQWPGIRALAIGIWGNSRLRTMILSGLAILGTIALAIGATSEHLKMLMPLPEPHAGYVHFIRPARGASVDACRAFLSGQVLGYPAPTLYGFDQEFKDSTYVDKGRSEFTLFQIMWMLNGLGKERDDDLVVIADGENTWFQLPLGTLIERYHAINREAYQRAIHQMGKKAVEQESIQQKIVFAAQRRCEPNAKSEPACYAIPKSPLPKDLYRKKTDDKDAHPEQLLPRYLDTNVIVGPVRDMRAMFLLAGKKGNGYGQQKTDYARILNEIYGEQEYQRKVISARYSRGRSFSAWLRSQRQDAKNFAPNPSYKTMPHYSDHPFDFGISLDYSGLLSSSSFGAENDYAWVHYNDTSDIAAASQHLDIAKPRVSKLPEDIAHSRPPYFALNAFPPTLPNATWSSLPLMTNLRTGVVPAILHEAGAGSNKDQRRDDWWRRMWYTPELKGLIRANMNPGRAPLAVDRRSDGGMVWFPKEQERRGGRKQGGDWVPWEDVCGGAADRVFVGRN